MTHDITAPDFHEHFHSARPEDVLAHCWFRLEQAQTRPGDPMRTAVLGTVRAGATDTGVALRTVVVRAVDRNARRVLCNTDRRTDKISQIGVSPGIGWLFYDPITRTQLRLTGSAEVLGEPALDPHWSVLPTVSHRNFLTERAPGTTHSQWTTDQSAYSEATAGDLSANESEQARAHFAVIATTVTTLDWVQLDPNGNARARFVWDPDRSCWDGSWVVP